MALVSPAVTEKSMQTRMFSPLMVRLNSVNVRKSIDHPTAGVTSHS
jgi:hypothetical protein